MNSALFKTPHIDGGCFVIDLSTVTGIEVPEDGECFYVYASGKTFQVAFLDLKRFTDAWSALKDRQEEQAQPMMMMMGQEDNSGLVDVFGGGLR
jgi:hypothetical protein